jgi:hypothetical protein
MLMVALLAPLQATSIHPQRRASDGKVCHGASVPARAEARCSARPLRARMRRNRCRGGQGRGARTKAHARSPWRERVGGRRVKAGPTPACGPVRSPALTGIRQQLVHQGIHVLVLDWCELVGGANHHWGWLGSVHDHGRGVAAAMVRRTRSPSPGAHPVVARVPRVGRAAPPSASASVPSPPCDRSARRRHVMSLRVQ